MSKRYVQVVFAAVFAGLLVGCGDAEPKTPANQAELKTAGQPGTDKGKTKSPQANTSKAKQATAKPKPKRPEPPWLLTLTGGATHQAFLRPEGNHRFFLGRAVRFSGLYELRGNRLIMEKPVDPAEVGFEWEARGPDEYVLVAQRPAIDLQNYVGAVLKRVQEDQANKPPAP
jgi:hypothetical protein